MGFVRDLIRNTKGKIADCHSLIMLRSISELFW